MRRLNLNWMAVQKQLTSDQSVVGCIIFAAFVIPAPVPNAETLLGLPRLCAFRFVTGSVCPGCGMTRSLVASAHLHIMDALDFNPIGPVVLCALIITWLMPFMKPFLHDKAFFIRLKPTAQHVKTIFFLCVVISLLVTWGLRIAKILPSPT